MNCPICQAHTNPMGTACILSKYQVTYHRCAGCGFVRTEQPYWLAEAYSEAISRLDVGVVQRNLYNASITASVISTLFAGSRTFVDYGGGHGTLVRLMRDRGFDFRWSDKYASNLYARGFEHRAGDRHELLTAFEVLEHLPDPMSEISEMLKLSDNLLTTTMLLPDPVPAPPHWWYYAVQSGQHVSFYTQSSLQQIASHFDLHLLSHGPYHMLTRKPRSNLLFQFATRHKFAYIVGLLRRRTSFAALDLRAVTSDSPGPRSSDLAV